mgnify:CR=1 FL=1
MPGLFYGKKASQRRTLNPKTQEHNPPTRARLLEANLPNRGLGRFPDSPAQTPSLTLGQSYGWARLETPSAYARLWLTC